MVTARSGWSTCPCMGRPVELVWRKRTWRCAEPVCPTGVITEQHDTVAKPRALLTVRACWWAIGQLRREHASVQGLARQLGTTWRTVWSAIKPLLAELAAEESRFDGVTSLGVDEHVWHHVSTRPVEHGGGAQKELTGRVALSRAPAGRPRLGCSISPRADPAPPTPIGSRPATTRSGLGSESRRWIRS